MAKDIVGPVVETDCEGFLGLRAFRTGFGLVVSPGPVVLVESDR